MKKCASPAPEKEPGKDECSLRVEKCQEAGSEDCVAIKLDCMKGGLPPTPAEQPGWEIDSCWRKYKECYGYKNDPALCESVGETCKKLETEIDGPR
jgi:hypothetical protein